MYVPEPPDGVTVAEPFEPPKQVTLLLAVVVSARSLVPGVTTNVHIVEFPCVSVTVMVTVVGAEIAVPGAGF